MKQYRLFPPRKMGNRTDIGNCLTCGKPIEKGQMFVHADPGYHPFSFHVDCEVKMELIGKNTIQPKQEKTEAEVQQKVDAIIEAASSISADSTEPIEPSSEQSQPEASDVAIATYCSKCNAIHNVGTRRYRQHKLYLTVKQS